MISTAAAAALSPPIGRCPFPYSSCLRMMPKRAAAATLPTLFSSPMLAPHDHDPPRLSGPRWLLEELAAGIDCASTSLYDGTTVTDSTMRSQVSELRLQESFTIAPGALWSTIQTRVLLMTYVYLHNRCFVWTSATAGTRFHVRTSTLASNTTGGMLWATSPSNKPCMSLYSQNKPAEKKGRQQCTVFYNTYT